MKSSLRILFLSSALVILAAGCSQAQPAQKGQGLNDSNLEQGQAATVQPGEETSPTHPVRVAPTPPSNSQPAKTVTVPQATSTPPATDNRPWITQTVDGSSNTESKVQFTPGQSEYDVLDATHQVKSIDYGSMGKFVTSIDGVTADNKHFWEFYVNGKSSNVGASAYKLQPGDVIEWKLSVLNNSGE
jgi:hypothetical protein